MHVSCRYFCGLTQCTKNLIKQSSFFTNSIEAYEGPPESQIQCAHETQAQAADKSESLATERTQIPSPKEVRTQASETLVTEGTQIQSRIQASAETETQAVEEIRPQDNEGTGLLMLDGKYIYL